MRDGSMTCPGAGTDSARLPVGGLVLIMIIAVRGFCDTLQDGNEKRGQGGRTWIDFVAQTLRFITNLKSVYILIFFTQNFILLIPNILQLPSGLGVRFLF